MKANSRAVLHMLSRAELEKFNASKEDELLSLDLAKQIHIMVCNYLMHHALARAGPCCLCPTVA